MDKRILLDFRKISFEEFLEESGESESDEAEKDGEIDVFKVAGAEKERRWY